MEIKVAETCMYYREAALWICGGYVSFQSVDRELGQCY
jgi:hypothetical protein